MYSGYGKERKVWAVRAGKMEEEDIKKKTRTGCEEDEEEVRERRRRKMEICLEMLGEGRDGRKGLKRRRK